MHHGRPCDVFFLVARLYDFYHNKVKFIGFAVYGLAKSYRQKSKKSFYFNLIRLAAA
jgi:hypothetical protein